MTPTTKPPELNPNLVLPVGTRIVARVEVKTDASRASTDTVRRIAAEGVYCDAPMAKAASEA